MDQGIAANAVRILMLEDSVTDAQLIERKLGTAGIDFVTQRVDTKEAFVSALEAFQPGIVLCNYELPRFGGLSAVALTRQTHPEIPVIVVTGSRLSDMDAVALLSAGAADYVRKDHLARLPQAIRRALDVEQGIRARKAAEQALREKSQMLERIFNTTHISVVYLDRNLNFIRVNKAYADACGYPPEYFRGKNHFDLYPHAENEAIFRTVVETGEMYSVKAKPFSFPDHPEWGVTYWDWTLHPLKADDGTVDGLLFVLLNVTDSVRSNQALEESEEKFRAISSSAQDAIIMLDNEGKISFWNAAAQKIFGYGDDEALGRGMHDILAPARFRDAYLRGFAQFRETGKGPVIGKTLEFEARRRDGTEFAIELSLSALRIQGAWHAVGIVRDITARKQGIEALNASRDLLRSVIENAPIRVFWKDRESHYLGCNTAFAKDAGMSRPEEMLGKDDFQMTWHDQAELYRADDKNVMDSDVPKLGYEEPQTTPDGKTIWLRTSKVPLHGATGKVIGMLGIYDDVTERKRAEEALRKSEAGLAEAQHLAHIGSWSWDISTDTISWSPEYYRIYNYDPSLPTPNYAEHLKAYTPESAKLLDEAVKRTMTSAEAYALELELAKPDVAGKWVSARGAVIRDAQGNVTGLYGTAHDITERKKAEADLLRLNRTLKTLSESNRTLLRARDEADLMQDVCAMCVNSGGYLLAWIGLARQDENRTIDAAAAFGSGADYVEALHLTWDEQAPGGRGPTGTAARTGHTQIANDIPNDPRMAAWREAAIRHGYASSIALPLKTNEQPFGVLSIYSADPGAFTAPEADLLEEVANDLAFGIVNLRMRNERNQAVVERQQYADRLRESLEDALQAIAATVEMRDPYTAGHQRRVADLAAAIAREMGIPEEQTHGIHLAGIVHDLGKIHIPAEVLSKPTRLTEIEFSFIKTHPQAGYDILKGIDFPWPIAQAVLQHHERLDGSGYPQGLKDDAITLEARILSVADVVEAMASHRPYRPGLGIDAALKEITANRGVLYDASIVDACVTLFTEKGYAFPPP